MSRWLLALLLILLATVGCKGKLPKSLIAPKPIKPGSYTAMFLGGPAPPFDGEIVMGSSATESIKPGDLIVVSKFLALQNTSPFFYHNKLFPKVRWVQYVEPGQVSPTLKRVEELKKEGETVEGFTLIQFDLRKNPLYWTDMNVWGAFTIVKDGRIYGYCDEKDVDRTISSILGGKFDPKEIVAKQNRRRQDFKVFADLWKPIVTSYYERRISHSEFTRQLIPIYPKLVPRERSYLLKNYLVVYSECRSLQEIQPMLSAFHRGDEWSAFELVHDIKRHVGHNECRPRVLEEYKIAIQDPAIDEFPESCLDLAEVAIDFDRKKEAIKLLNLMINSPNLKGRYAKLWREPYDAAYETLMWRATH
jgi:hypothetical protein